MRRSRSNSWPAQEQPRHPAPGERSGHRPYHRHSHRRFAARKIKARLVDLGGTALAGSPADFGKLIADDTEKWGKVIRAANIKPE